MQAEGGLKERGMSIARLLVAAVVLAPLLAAVRALRASDCWDACHVDNSSGGGGCNTKTDEEREQEEACRERCNDQRSTPPAASSSTRDR